MRERRARYQAQPGLVKKIVADGTACMRAEARETMGLVRDAMGLYRV
jgi:tryptophanyl-tRNA synthetase